MRRYSWWVRAVSGGNIFYAKYRGRFGGSQMSGGGNHYFARNKEAFPCVRPWTQLSASPCTVHFRCMSVVDHVDHATPRAPGRWTMARPRKGTTRSRGRRDSGCPRGEEYEGSLVRLRCRHRRITGGVGEWRDGLASGGSSMGAMRPPWQHSRPRKAGAGGTTGAALGGWSRKTRG